MTFEDVQPYLKIMVCIKSGQIHDHEKWIFKGKLLEIVNDFNYLGTYLTIMDILLLTKKPWQTKD